jgi:DNA adenine methylase
MARPFLKWAGGKRQLLSEIESMLPSDISECKTYVEPFLGGGAVLFRLLEKFEFESVLVSDINPELILCYQAIRDDYATVADSLGSRSKAYPVDKEGQKEYYYNARHEWNSGVGDSTELEGPAKAERAALTIFLNKTCFNGLFRVNKKGLFNVPCNYTKRPSFPTEVELLEVHEALQGTDIKEASFEQCEEFIDDESFVYFDPPYRPLSDTSGFVSYSKEDFDDDDQRRLAGHFRRLDARGARLMLSNSDPKNTTPDDDFFDDLYSGFRVERVTARRSINSVGGGRGEINEILVTNY